MKVKKIILSFLAVAVVFSGCSRQAKETAQPVDSDNNTTTITTTEEAATMLDTTEATTVYDDEDWVEYAEANYFMEKVKQITYYRNGKEYVVSPDTETGKQIILMTKQRYIYTAEQPLKENELKNKVSDLKKNGKALIIEFDKSSQQTYEGGELNDFQSVFVDFQAWFYPLEGDEAAYFAPLPNQECTFRRLGSQEQLLEYLEKNIVND